MLTASASRHLARTQFPMPAAEAIDRPRPVTSPGVVDRIRNSSAHLGPRLATSVVPFLLIVYVALNGGGYDAIVRGEVGIAVWWIVLIGAIVGILPIARMSTAAWVGIAAVGAFGIWTGAGIAWSESSERSVLELARVGTYLGVLVLALGIQGHDGLRRTVVAVGAAISLIAVLALGSRLHPAWFPANETASVLDVAQARLNYPVDYWNGLAALMAIGMPLMLTIAVSARRLVAQAFATAVIPVIALACFYTLSRGGALEMGVALVAFLVLSPRRLAALPTVALALLGSGLLISAATQRHALEDGLATAEALQQGDEMLAITVLVCVGVGLLRAAIGLAARNQLGPRLNPSRRASLAGLGAAIAIAVVGAIALDLPGELGDRWTEFKSPDGPEAGDTAGRFESASGNGRYQYWQGAVKANATDPLLGIGPGSYEFYWARAGDYPGFIRDAHSLYIEAFAELGIIGLVLTAGPMLALLGFGAFRALTARPSARPWLAGATAGCAAFATAAAVDWAWELAVLPVIFFCIVAAILNHREPAGVGPETSRGWKPRAALAALAVPAVVAIGIPLFAYKAVAASEESFNAGRLDSALESARDADELEPWAASPPTWEALALEGSGELDAAAQAAAEATEEETTNWRTWLILSRIEESRGNAEAAVATFDRARSLNPRSGRFAPP